MLREICDEGPPPVDLGHAASSDMEHLPLRVIHVPETLLRHGRGVAFLRFPASWHIISHTWSRDLQDLSSKIGEALTVASSAAPCMSSSSSCSYEDLFRHADLSSYPVYGQFLEFLSILDGDGVMHVWFDAICINQTSETEKQREIGQMGSYYERSLGCYVVQHGIGKGYGIFRIDYESLTYQFARWFTRVWTFQEWILPPTTTFVVDIWASNQALLHLLHYLSSSTESRSRCIFCALDVTLNFAKATEFRMWYSFRPPPVESLVSCLTSTCCNGRVHFRPTWQSGPKKKSSGQDILPRPLFFVDDLAYINLIKLELAIGKEDHTANAFHISRGGLRPDRGLIVPYLQQTVPSFPAALVEQSAVEHQMFLARAERRMKIKEFHDHDSNSYATSPEETTRLVLEDIRYRMSTREEDRVLSVLKLLGVEGIMQVRTGKTLREQVIELAKMLLWTTTKKKKKQQQQKQKQKKKNTKKKKKKKKKQKKKKKKKKKDDLHEQAAGGSLLLLLRLCLVDGWGNPMPHMSWAPAFEVEQGSEIDRVAQVTYRPLRVDFHDFQGFAKTLQIDADTGALTLLTLVLPCRLIHYYHHPQEQQPKQNQTELLPPKETSSPFHEESLPSSFCKDMALQVLEQHGCDLHLLEIENQVGILLRLSTDYVPGGSSCILQPHPQDETTHEGSLVFISTQQLDLLSNLHKFPLWILYMGHALTGRSRHNSRGILAYFLVCIRNEQGLFHKVGYVAIPQVPSHLSSATAATTIAIVDGFGWDLSAYM